MWIVRQLLTAGSLLRCLQQTKAGHKSRARNSVQISHTDGQSSVTPAFLPASQGLLQQETGVRSQSSSQNANLDCAKQNVDVLNTKPNGHSLTSAQCNCLDCFFGFVFYSATNLHLMFSEAAGQKGADQSPQLPSPALLCSGMSTLGCTCGKHVSGFQDWSGKHC